MFDDRRQRRGLALPAVIMGVAGILGTGVGKAIGALLGDGVAYDLIAGRQPFGLEPAHFDFWVFDVTFGCHLNLNAVGLLFMLLALYVYKRA